MNARDMNAISAYASNAGNVAIVNATREQYTVLGFSRANGRRVTKRHFRLAGGKDGALEFARSIDKKLERVDVYDNGMRCLIKRLR